MEMFHQPLVEELKLPLRRALLHLLQLNPLLVQQLNGASQRMPMGWLPSLQCGRMAAKEVCSPVLSAVALCWS